MTSIRVEPKPLRSYPWLIRLLFWIQKRRYGRVLLPGMLWGRVPRLFMPLALLYGAIDRRSSPIPPALRSLITVRVSQINWCAFCVDINSSTLLKRGVTAEKLAALATWRESPLYTEIEKTALAYAEAMIITGASVSDDLAARLHRHFPPDALIDLTALIAFQNLSSSFNAALAVPPQGFCQIPAKPGGA